MHGLTGCNIPGDLHQEHLNHICKGAIRDLDVNKTDIGIMRVGKAMATLAPVLEQFDHVNNIHDSRGTHCAPTSEEDRDAIVHQLQESGIFSCAQMRSHRTFPNPRDVLHAKSHDELCAWMIDHIV